MHVTQGLTPVASVTRRDAALTELRNAILSGRLMPGDRLKEVQLAKDLGISRPTLREGIYQLIHEGLERLKSINATGCVLLGDPAYYSRFGFAPDARLTLEGVPPEYFMRVAFSPVYGEGTVSYHPGFYG